MHFQEYDSLVHVLENVPRRESVRLFTSIPMNLTALDASSHFIAFGTNLGYLYIYDRRFEKLERIHTKKLSLINALKVEERLEIYLAVGFVDGSIFVYIIPTPESPEFDNIIQFTVSDVHVTTVTALLWSPNCSKLFSADAAGQVVCTQIDTLTKESSSYTVAIHTSPVCQLSYLHQHLLVSTAGNAVVYSISTGIATALRFKDKAGHYGAVFLPRTSSLKDLNVAATPQTNQIVLCDLHSRLTPVIDLHKDLRNKEYLKTLLPIVLLIKSPVNNNTAREIEFGVVRPLTEDFLVSWTTKALCVIDLKSKLVCAYCNIATGKKDIIRDVVPVLLNQEKQIVEIFVLISGVDMNYSLRKIATHRRQDCLEFLRPPLTTIPQIVGKVEPAPEDKTAPISDISNRVLDLFKFNKFKSDKSTVEDKKLLPQAEIPISDPEAQLSNKETTETPISELNENNTQPSNAENKDQAETEKDSEQKDVVKEMLNEAGETQTDESHKSKSLIQSTREFLHENSESQMHNLKTLVESTRDFIYEKANSEQVEGVEEGMEITESGPKIVYPKHTDDWLHSGPTTSLSSLFMTSNESVVEVRFGGDKEDENGTVVSSSIVNQTVEKQITKIRSQSDAAAGIMTPILKAFRFHPKAPQTPPSSPSNSAKSKTTTFVSSLDALSPEIVPPPCDDVDQQSNSNKTDRKTRKCRKINSNIRQVEIQEGLNSLKGTDSGLAAYLHRRLSLVLQEGGPPGENQQSLMRDSLLMAETTRSSNTSTDVTDDDTDVDLDVAADPQYRAGDKAQSIYHSESVKIRDHSRSPKQTKKFLPPWNKRPVSLVETGRESLNSSLNSSTASNRHIETIKAWSSLGKVSDPPPPHKTGHTQSANKSDHFLSESVKMKETVATPQPVFTDEQKVEVQQQPTAETGQSTVIEAPQPINFLEPTSPPTSLPPDSDSIYPGSNVAVVETKKEESVTCSVPIVISPTTALSRLLDEEEPKKAVSESTVDPKSAIIDSDNLTSELSKELPIEICKTNEEEAPQSVPKSSCCDAHSCSLENRLLTYCDHWNCYKSPTGLSSVVVCDSAIYVTDSKSMIHGAPIIQKNMKELDWSVAKKSTQADLISVSPDALHAWRLHKSRVLTFTGSIGSLAAGGLVPSGLTRSRRQRSLSSSDWEELCIDVQHIEVDSSSAVLITQRGYVKLYIGFSSRQRFFRPITTKCPTPAKQATILSNIVWSLVENSNKTDESQIRDVFCLLIGSQSKEDLIEKEWTKVTVPSSLIGAADISSIHLGVKETAWLLTTDRRIFFTTSVNAATPQGSGQWFEISLNGLQPFTSDSNSQTGYNALGQLNTMFNKILPLNNLAAPLQNSFILGGASTPWLISARCSPCGDLGSPLWIYSEERGIVASCNGPLLGHAWNRVIPRGMEAVSSWSNVSAVNLGGRVYVWSVQTMSNEVFCYNTATGNNLSVPLSNGSGTVLCLAASSQSVWVILSKDKKVRVMRRDGVRSNCPQGTAWHRVKDCEKLASRLVHISCGDGQVWAVDCRGGLYVRPDEESHKYSGSSGTKSPYAWQDRTSVEKLPQQSLRAVYSGVNHKTGPAIWGIDQANYRVYVRLQNSSTKKYYWAYVSGPTAISLSLTDTHVWLLDKSSRVYIRCNISQDNPMGEFWFHVPSPPFNFPQTVKELAVAAGNFAWAIDSEGQMLQHHSQVIDMGSITRSHRSVSELTKESSATDLDRSRSATLTPSLSRQDSQEDDWEFLEENF